MKRNMKFKSNRQSKKYTLADFNKARQSSDYNVSLEDAYEIVAGYKEIRAKSPQARDLIYKRALKMVRDDDAEFAKELVANSGKETSKSKELKTIISLKDAYDIAGGFKTVDKDTFDKAMKLLKRHDPEFAKVLMQMHKSGTSFSAMSIDEIKIFDSSVEKSAEIAYSVLSNESLEQIESQVLQDKEIKVALSNTPILDEEGVELVDDAKNDVQRSIVRTATIDSIPDIIEASAEEENSQEEIVERVKNKTLGLLGSLRLEAVRPSTSEYVKALKEKNTKFLSGMATKMKNAFNFKKKIKISGQAILNRLNKVRDNVSEYSKKVAEAVSSPKAKVLMNKIKVAAMTTIIATSSLLSGCINKGNYNTTTQQARIETVDTAEAKTDTVVSVTEVPVVQKTTSKEIVVPSEYSDSLGLMKKSQWESLQTTFNDGRPTFEKYYKMVTDDMRGDLTRTQYLFAYQRMGFWNLPKHQEALKQLDKYFECGEKLTIDVLPALKEVMPDGSINGVVGTLNRYATNRTIECGEDPVLNIKEVKVAKKQTTPVKEQDTFIEEGSKTIITKEEGFIDEAGTLTIKTVEVDSTTLVEPKIDVYKANDLSMTNAKLVGVIDANKATDLNIENKKNILISDLTSDTTSISSSTISVQEGFIEEQGSITYVDALPSDTVSVQEGFIEEQGSVTYVDTPINFTSTISASDSAIVDEGEVQIVADSEEVEAGTPAAGDVPERGGYLNKGLTKRQYEGSKTRIRNRFGENAYEEFAERITPEMRAKDGIFEGLSIAQAMYTTEKMILWSNDKHGEFADEIKIITDYLKGCTDVISMEDAESVKAVIDRVNTDGTIDGVVGKTNIMAKYYQVGDCGETGKYGLVKIPGKAKVTTPDAPDFPRFFMIRNKAPEGFVDEPGKCITIVQTVYEENVVEPIVEVYKANDLSLEGAKFVGNISVEEATNLDIENKEVLINDAPAKKETKSSTRKKNSSVSEKPDARADYFRVRDQYKNQR